MSSRTSGIPGPVPPIVGSRWPPPQRVRTPARFAAAGLLTVAMMVPLSACSAPEVRQYIAEARSQAETIGDDLGEITPHLPELPEALRTEVADAVASAEAAIDETRAALAEAASATDGTAALALADAQIALDAASAQIGYVAELAEAAGADVADNLHRLRGHLNELRGETDRASS